MKLTYIAYRKAKNVSPCGPYHLIWLFSVTITAVYLCTKDPLRGRGRGLSWKTQFQFCTSERKLNYAQK